MAEYMVIKDNIIKAIYCGEVESNKNVTALPENHQVQVGDNILCYNEDYTRKSDVELIKLGFMQLPQGYKLEQDNIVEMNLDEKILAGLEDVPRFCKIVDNNIIEMEEYEKLAIMQRQEKEDYHRKKRDNLINKEIWKISRHEQEKLLGIKTTLNDDEFLKLLKYIQDLRDITIQEYFPDFVDYPSL